MGNFFYLYGFHKLRISLSLKEQIYIIVSRQEPEANLVSHMQKKDSLLCDDNSSRAFLIYLSGIKLLWAIWTVMPVNLGSSNSGRTRFDEYGRVLHILLEF